MPANIHDMEPLIINHPGLELAGYSRPVSLQSGDNLRQIPAFWNDYAERLRQPLLAALGRPHAAEYGVVYDFAPSQTGFRYMIAMEDRASRAPDGCERRAIPAGKYAVFTTPPVESAAAFGAAIAQTWQHIHQQWLPESAEWEHAPRDAFERYDGRCAPGQPQLQMDIYIPIQPKC
ncbi:GyrI-like domain-containing protein [Chromobacterium sp. ASV23]|uniref:GyrI-like domain-containing protein n=1 Tax=Chromobacterium sp. ASV23 TaxID=2795110 RepID=UPI001E46CB73|nr:GyrI-like domain-containing protein [Chromobacterium sp. ASV23]